MKTKRKRKLARWAKPPPPVCVKCGSLARFGCPMGGCRSAGSTAGLACLRAVER